MSLVFTGGACAMSVEDNNRTELILLQVDGSTWFSDTFIMNFGSTDKSDYQINKSIDQSFIFSSFGHSITTLTIHGFQSASVMSAQQSGNNLTLSSVQVNEDIERIYRRHCISSAEPRLVKITTGTTGIFKHGSVYKGLMVAFEKKPMGEDKILGYAFTLTFVCEREPDTTGDDSDTYVNEYNDTDSRTSYVPSSYDYGD